MTQDQIKLKYTERQFEWFKAMFYLSLARNNIEAADNYAT